jgi:hypothetical protein
MSRPAKTSVLSLLTVGLPCGVLACTPQPTGPQTPPAPSMMAAPSAASSAPSAPSAIASVVTEPTQSGSPAVPSVYPKLDADAEAQRKTSAERLLAGGVSLAEAAPLNPRRVAGTVVAAGVGSGGTTLRFSHTEEATCRHRLLPRPPKEMSFTVTVDADGVVTGAKVAALGSAKPFAECAEAALKTKHLALPPGEHKGTFTFDNVP